MLTASKTYRQQIEKIPFRNRSYMIVSIGVINQLAQAHAEITSQTSYISNNALLFESELPQFRYATYEQNWWRADGKMLFAQQPGSADYIFNQGAIAKDTMSAITIGFDTSYDIKGLTIAFPPDAYPTAFTVTNGTVTYTYSNDSDFFTTADIYDGSTYLTITPTAMLGGTQRLHIEQMYMGIGLSFANNDIINVDKTEFVSPITESLPELNLSVTIQNYDGLWDVNNSSSSINYLESGQEASVQYGYELDDGSIYWMNGGVCYLTQWSANAQEMSFEATDIIATLTDKYYGGVVSTNGTSAYDLAVAVLTDAGLDSDRYELDTYLHNVILYNPIPAVTHAEALQLIANASRARLRTDRTDGHIIMEFAAELEINPERMEIESNSATPFSNLPSVIQGQVQQDYAMYTLNYWTADGTMLFLPQNSDYVTTGYSSRQIALGTGIYPEATLYPSASLYPISVDPSEQGGYGSFDTNPTVTVTLEASYTFYTITLTFSANPPGSFIIHSYLSGELVESYLVNEDIELETVVEHDFPELDKIVIEFTSAPVYNRIYLDNIQFGEQTNFSFSKQNTTTHPVGTRDEKTKDLQVIKTIYSNGTEMQQIISDEVNLTGVDTYTFYLSQASHGYVVVLDGMTQLTITSSSAFYVTVNTASYSGTHEIAVNGYTYNTAQTIYTQSLNTTGIIQQWENPLISEDGNASLVAEWIGDYLINNAEYDVEYRGEPRLDAGDLAYLENDYVDGLMVRIENHGISFNGALHGSATCRLARS